MDLSPAQRIIRGRLGAYTALSRHDPAALTAKARATYRASFAEGHACRVCPTYTMPEGLAPAERARRGEALRKAHYARLSLASAKARSRR